MNDLSIRRLRNKIWFSLWISFFAIAVFALTTVYLSHTSFHRQQFQNARENIGRFEVEEMLNSDDLHGIFILESTLGGQIISLQGDTTFNLTQATEMLALANAQVSSQIRDRFLWRVPTPFIVFDESYWFFSRVVGDELGQIIEEAEGAIMNDLSDDDFPLDFIYDRTVYHFFWDATALLRIIETVRFNFIMMGVVTFVLLGGAFYVIAKLIAKPIELAFKRQKQFVADASHELKTPLTMIKNNLSVLRLDQEATIASQMQWLDNVQFGFERMSHLTTDLLTLAKLEEQAKQSICSTFDFSQAANWVAHSMKPLADAKGLDFSWEIQSKVDVKQDGEKIMQVMTILMDNAIKYTSREGRINLQVEKKKDMVSFTLANSGPGIPFEKLPHIFDRFYTVDEARSSENKSYGLGLAIAKTIVEQAGGTIGATSVPDDETTFWFSLKTTQ